jgi:hypothetical protein
MPAPVIIEHTARISPGPTFLLILGIMAEDTAEQAVTTIVNIPAEAMGMPRASLIKGQAVPQALSGRPRVMYDMKSKTRKTVAITCPFATAIL